MVYRNFEFYDDKTVFDKYINQVSTVNDEKPLLFKTLEEVQPYHWSYAYKDEELFD